MPFFFLSLSSSDNGTEFSSLAPLAKKYEFLVYRSSDSVTKNSLTEIANKLLQDRIVKYLSSSGSNNWLHALGSILTGINQMKRDILFGYSSYDVKYDKDVADIVRKKSALRLKEYNDKFEGKKPEFVPGDRVKVVGKKRTFQRSYDKVTTSIDFISRVLPTRPITYKLVQKRGRPYYSFELIKYGDSDRKKKFDLYVLKSDNKKEHHRRLLRSGKSNSEKLYHVKSKSDFSFNDFLTKSQVQKLIEDDRLANAAKFA